MLEDFVVDGEGFGGMEVECDEAAAALPVGGAVAAPAADSAVGEVDALPVAVIVVDVVVSAEDADDPL